MFLLVLFLLSIFFLIGMFALCAVNSAFRCMHKHDSKKELKTLGHLFFYRKFHLFFFPNHEYEGIFFATVCSQSITRFCYAACAILFLLHTNLYFQAIQITEVSPDFSWFWLIASFVGLVALSFVVGDYFPRIFGTRHSKAALRFCTPLASIFMYIAFPLTFVFLKISQMSSKTVSFDYLTEPMAEAKQEIIDLIHKAEFSPSLDSHDKKLIESVLTFKERIAREVMVPRVDVFSLSADTTIKDAAKLIETEGYSRIPLYRNTVDNIVGVLMYKDLLNKLTEYSQKGNDPAVLLAPVESIQKNVLHVPETKKISNLLQEFRKKQVHMAIVVDEYGGTEGVVTIEDILEEIVGEIADEYDLEEELFQAEGGGSWMVDARMNILDVEEELGFKIPADGEYDTIGGYVFHTAGEIPSKGFIIHQEDFEMEILQSNDRCVEKVRIKPVLNQRHGNEFTNAKRD